VSQVTATRADPTRHDRQFVAQSGQFWPDSHPTGDHGWSWGWRRPIRSPLA